MSTESERLVEAEKQLIQELEKHKDGISVKGIPTILSAYTKEECTKTVNKILQSGNAEVCTIVGSDDSIIRYRKSKLPTTATQEEELVYSLIEESGKAGIWIKYIREKSGLTEAIIRRVLKGLEQKKFVKSITAPGTTKKSYILYDIEAGDDLTGGTFYSGQQFDSQFVRDLLGVCVKMLQDTLKDAIDKYPNNLAAQISASSVKSEMVAKFIHDKQVTKVQLAISDVENLLEIAVVDGKVEKSLNNKYRALNQSVFVSPLVSMPCYYCPMRNECAPGHRISPESCIYIKNCFEL
jgi:DNA-directed RNA polymerase III subunit RPC6